MKDKKIVFMGTPLFSVPILEMLIKETNVVLVVTQPDALVGRKKELRFSPVKEVAIKNNIEVFQPEKIRNDYSRVLEVNPDIIITSAYGQIIPDILLETPKYKAINVHASLLPKYRGGSPIHKAIIDGEDRTGITIMYMSSKMDAGDIIYQKEVIIEKEDNVGTLHDKLSVLGRNTLLEVLPDIFNNKNKRISQNEDMVTFAYNIKREDEKLDFNKSTREVHNHIRGLYPFPVSYAMIDGEVIKICESYIGKSDKNGSNGEIINIYNNGIGVKCSDGEIVITKLKPSGKKEMSAREYINGKKDLVGRMLC